MGVNIARGLNAAVPENFLDRLDGHTLGGPAAGGSVTAGVRRDPLDAQLLHQAGKRAPHHMMVAGCPGSGWDKPFGRIALKEVPDQRFLPS